MRELGAAPSLNWCEAVVSSRQGLAMASSIAPLCSSRLEAPAAPRSAQQRLQNHVQLRQRCINPSSSAWGRQRRQRQQLVLQAAAASEQQQQQQQQDRRVAASSTFEEYILDLQRRITQASKVLRKWGSPVARAFCRACPQNVPLAPCAHSMGVPRSPLNTVFLQQAEELDGSGARFEHDRWSRSPDNPNAGYGITSGAAGLGPPEGGSDASFTNSAQNFWLDSTQMLPGK